MPCAATRRARRDRESVPLQREGGSLTRRTRALGKVLPELESFVLAAQTEDSAADRDHRVRSARDQRDTDGSGRAAGMSEGQRSGQRDDGRDPRSLVTGEHLGQDRAVGPACDEDRARRSPLALHGVDQICDEADV